MKHMFANSARTTYATSGLPTWRVIFNVGIVVILQKGMHVKSVEVQRILMLVEKSEKIEMHLQDWTNPEAGCSYRRNSHINDTGPPICKGLNTLTRSTIRADVGVAIFPQTISRHLAEATLKSKRPFRALPLTPEHRQLRLLWCQARSMWNVPDWQKVVFSDESRFVLGTDDNRVRVWRRPGPFLNGLPEAIFQQDNARPHTARVAQDFLRHFHTLPWPARSTDLSPVEHVWDQLKRQMPSCHSVHDLELASQVLWAHLPQDNIRCLINSMPDRVVACIAAGGGPTRY
ncbi:transposable element Tcb2 transposase [Trichonephila clavipes]|nr:transposable element Tcb2 transposase [Trichonephila clavipes]